MAMTRLQEIKQRAERATKGPWNAYTYGEEAPSLNFKDKLTYVRVESENQIVGFIYCDQVGKPHLCDSGFIAHAREDIPYLINMVDGMQGLIEELDIKILELGL